MNQAQVDFLNNMDEKSARALMAKFGDDPEVAAARSEYAYIAFCRAFETVHPGSYIQRVNSSKCRIVWGEL